MMIPRWLLVMFIVGGYIGGWIITAWALVRYFDAEVNEATWDSAIWPLFLPLFVLVLPFCLIGWIVDKMTEEK